MRTLVLWGQAPLAEARVLRDAGARVVLWGRPAEEGEGDLQAPAFGAEAMARVESAARQWATSVGEATASGEKRFMDLFAWNDVPLWPLVHRFLASPKSLAGRSVRLVESLSLLFESELPDEVEGVGLLEDEAILLERVCTARGLLFHGGPVLKAPRGASRPTPGLLERMLGWRQALGGGGTRPARGEIVFVRPEEASAEVSAAFERLLLVAREEMALGAAALGGEGAPAPEDLLDPSARAAAAAAEAAFTRAFLELKSASATTAAFRYEGVSFADRAAEPDLRALLERVLPAAVRRAEGLRAVLRSGSAKALCAVAGDALALGAARLEGVPAVAFSGANDGPHALLALERAVRGTGMVG